MSNRIYVYAASGSFRFINERVMAATRGSLKIDPDNGFHISFFIYDVDGSLIRALTTNQSLSGIRYSDSAVYYEADKILSWDEFSGKIALGIKLLPSWTIEGQYYYEADDYQYTQIDLNPLSNKSILNSTVVFYLIPDVDDEDYAIHHLVVNRNGVITECSQGAGYTYPSFKLKTATGNYNSHTVIGDLYISEQSVDTFLTEKTVGQDNTLAYVILAEVSFLDRNFPEDQIVYDVRQPGAVIKNDRFADAIQSNPKILQSLLGYGEFGEEIPRNGVVVFNPPITLLSDYGGDLSEEDAKTLLTQHLDASVYPLIQWQYPVSEIDIDSATPLELTLSWTWEGAGLTYELLRKDTPAGEWVVVNTQVAPARPVQDLTYTDVGLVADTVYYYSVRITENSITFPNGNSVAAKVRPV